MRIAGKAMLAVLAAASLTLTGCGSSGTSDANAGSSGGASGSSSSDAGSGGDAKAQAIDSLRIMAPAAPGGGWDSTSRTAQQALEQSGAAKNVEVFNVPGAGGTVGLARLKNEKGKGDLLMTMGLVMTGAILTNKSPATLDDTTPIAELTSEYEAIVVPTSSKYKTLQDLVNDWKADPGAVSIAGGSAGGTDQILAGLVAQAAGIDPKKVNYIAFSGGGEALAAILGGKVSAGVSGVSEFVDQVKAGKLRALAVSSPEKLPEMDAPTIKDAGLDVELANWRGMVAPAGITDDQKKALVQAITTMHDSQQWQDALKKNGWEDTFKTGDEFASFLKSENERVTKVLQDLGLV